MNRRSSVPLTPVIAALALAALLAEPTRAQYGPLTGGLSLSWENSRARVTQLSVAPSAPLPSGGNRVLVYLTADPEGKMPPEAVWLGADAGAIQNRGPLRLDGISIELKDASPSSGAGTPPEALDEEYGVEVTTLIDNPQVLVTKHRYDPLAYAGPLHFHRDDVLVVYLRGGYTWPAAAFWGAARVRRGDVDVIPANTLHRLANAVRKMDVGGRHHDGALVVRDIHDSLQRVLGLFPLLDVAHQIDEFGTVLAQEVAVELYVTGGEAVADAMTGRARRLVR